MAVSVTSALNRLLDGGPLAIKQLFHSTGELSGNLTLDVTYPNFLKIDAGGSARDISLPAEEVSEGLFYVIANWSSGAENLVVKNDADTPATIVTVNQNDVAVVWCDGSAWNLFGVYTQAQS